MSAQTFAIHVEFREDWTADQYHGDPAPADATEADCIEQVRAYIEKNGLYMFLTDWNILHGVDVWVGSTLVVSDGSLQRKAAEDLPA